MTTAQCATAYDCTDSTPLCQLLYSVCFTLLYACCSTVWYHPQLHCAHFYCILSPGVTVSPQQTGLQLCKDEAKLGLKSDGVLDQPAFVTQVDPTALQVLLHHLLELRDSLLKTIIHEWELCSNNPDFSGLADSLVLYTFCVPSSRSATFCNFFLLHSNSWQYSLAGWWTQFAKMYSISKYCKYKNIFCFNISANITFTNSLHHFLSEALPGMMMTPLTSLSHLMTALMMCRPCPSP